jgi:small subunit ribosomal protein S9
MDKAKKTVNFHGVGRRKAAVARVWMKPGKGDFLVNGRDCDSYFCTEVTRKAAKASLMVTSLDGKFDIAVNLHGGGESSQATAIRLGIARALLITDESLRKVLRKNGFLTVDARVKERKKYGQKGARAKFQFVKR